MTIEHKNITDPNIHEPKGASTANSGDVYVADGAGSGVFKKLSPLELSNLGSDGGVDGLSVRSDGLGNIEFVNDHTHGSMTITNNAVVFPLTAVADTTFNTPSQYTLLTGAGAPFAGENLHDMTFSVDRLTVSIPGMYQVHLWMGIASYPSSTAKVSVRYKINDTTYSTRKPTVKSGGVGAMDQLTGFGLLTLAAGDYIQIVVASDTTGNLVIGDCNTTLTFVGNA